MRLSFGEFVVDFSERRLVSGKQEIFERLWPGTFVTENNLATLVADLRASLSDQANEPRYIRTVWVGTPAYISPDAAVADVNADIVSDGVYSSTP